MRTNLYKVGGDDATWITSKITDLKTIDGPAMPLVKVWLKENYQGLISLIYEILNQETCDLDMASMELAPVTTQHRRPRHNLNGRPRHVQPEAFNQELATIRSGRQWSLESKLKHWGLIWIREMVFINHVVKEHIGSAEAGHERSEVGHGRAHGVCGRI